MQRAPEHTAATADRARLLSADEDQRPAYTVDINVEDRTARHPETGGVTSRDAAPWSPTRERSVDESGWSRRKWIWGTALLVVVVGVAVAVGVLFTRHSSKKACQWGQYRLPTSVSPDAYFVHWTPDFEEPFGFTGETVIHATVHEKTDCVTLHMVGLTLDSVVVNTTTASGEKHTSEVIKGNKIHHHDSNEMISLELKNPVSSGSSMHLSFAFHGKLGRTMNGLYLSQYNTTDSGGNEHTQSMVATQFEATYARHAFPCWDEPGFKANFTVQLSGVPDGMVALSNMPPSSDEVSGSRQVTTKQGTALMNTRTVQFQPSVPMSTYLLAVVVGHLDSVNGTIPRNGDSDDPLLIRVWSRPSLASDMNFALDAAVGVLPYYEKLFDLDFPLPKMDLVAIPDFAAGAMENWGLVTFRETALVVNPATASDSALQRVAVVVAHELAHQWFGNLVTTHWWGSLFLNEGWATFFEYRGTNATNPEFDIMESFVYEVPQVAMQTDSFAGTHPLARPDVDSSGAVEEMFDDISYQKGGSVFQMVQSYIQRASAVPNAFTAALHRYLEDHKYSTATASELWASLGAGSELDDLADDMEAWTAQPGYPVVEFSWVEDTPANGTRTSGTLRVSQRRFFRSPYSESQVSSKERNLKWWIPFTFAVQKAGPARDASQKMWNDGGFREKTWSEEFSYSVETDGWIKGNLNQDGYYRVAYPPAVWKALQTQMEKQLQSSNSAQVRSAEGPVVDSFSDSDRSGLVDDLVSVVMATSRNVGSSSSLRVGSAAPVADITTALEFLKFLRLESALAVWEPAVGHLMAIRDLLRMSAQDGVVGACSANMATFARYLLRPVTTAVGWGDGVDARQLAATTSSSSPVQTTYLRSLVLGASAIFNESSVVDKANEIFEASQRSEDPKPVPANLLSIVTKAYVRSGGRDAWTTVRDLYEAEEAPGTKITYLQSLAATTDADLLQETLEYSLSSAVRPQDTVSLIAAVAANTPHGPTLTWDFFKSNFATFVDRYGSGGFAASRLVGAAAGHFVDRSMASTVRSYFQQNTFQATELEIDRAVEAIHAHADFVEHQRGAACDWLADFVANR